MLIHLFVIFICRYEIYVIYCGLLELKLEDLTISDILRRDSNILENLYSKDSNISAVAREYARLTGIEYNDSLRRTTSIILRELLGSLVDDGSDETYQESRYRQLDSSKKRFIFSWAQNATPVHAPFLGGLEAYAKFLDADLHIIPGRYSNPTSIIPKEMRNKDYWDDKVVKYMDASQQNLHKYLKSFGNINTIPTGKYPLSGFDNFGGESSFIIGHPKVHMQAHPVLGDNMPKLSMTTGACTIENYTPTKSGAIASFDHRLGAVIVEIESDEIVHFRQVIANDDGHFTDLIYDVRDGQVFDMREDGTLSPPAIVLGDVHLGETVREVQEATDEILDMYNPEKTFVHDIFNGHSVSHWEAKDPITSYKKQKAGLNSLSRELEEMYEWVENRLEHNIVIVDANHNDWLDRYLRRDWTKDVANALEYSKLLQIALETDDCVLNTLLYRRFGDKIEFARRDTKYIIKDIDLAHHGDLNSGGTRGSIRAYSKVSTKTIVGHYHQTERINGCVSVGTMTPRRQHYAKGPNKKGNSHAKVDKYGEVQHFILNPINFKHTTLY